MMTVKDYKSKISHYHHRYSLPGGQETSGDAKKLSLWNWRHDGRAGQHAVEMHLLLRKWRPEASGEYSRARLEVTLPDTQNLGINNYLPIKDTRQNIP